MQNTKIRAAAFTCCLLFPLTRVRTFPGGLAQTPSAISRCLRATRLSATVSYFLLLFHFLYPAYFSFFAGNLHTQPATHPVRFFPAARTLRFHYFFVRSILILSQVATLSSGVSRPHLTRIILIHPQVRTSRSGLPAIRFPYLFLSKHSQPFTSHHTFFRRQPAISYPQHSYQFSSQNLARRLAGQHHSITNHSHRRPPSSPDASGLPPFPSTLPQPSTPPISHFFFFLSSTLFLFLFFFFLLSPFSFFLLFIIFSLHFLFSRLFLFAFLLFSFLFPFSFFYHITLHVFLCAPSQRLQNRTQFCKPV